MNKKRRKRENKFPRRSKLKMNEKSDSFGPSGKSFMDSLFHVSKPIDLAPIRRQSIERQSKLSINRFTKAVVYYRQFTDDLSSIRMEDICLRITLDLRWLPVALFRSKITEPVNTRSANRETGTGNCSSLIKRHRFVDWPRMKANPRVDLSIDEYIYFF